MIEVHETLFRMLLILALGMTGWALFFVATGRPVDGAFRSTYALTVGLTVLQALAGLWLVIDGRRPASSFHFLYGISLMVFTGAGYVFATRGPGRREALVFGIAAAAAVGLIWRAWSTANG